MKNKFFSWALLIVFGVLDGYTYFDSYLPCKTYIIEQQPDMTLCWVNSWIVILLNLFIALPILVFYISRYFVTKITPDELKRKVYPYVSAGLCLLGAILWFYL